MKVVNTTPVTLLTSLNCLPFLLNIRIRQISYSGLSHTICSDLKVLWIQTQRLYNS